MLAQRLSNVKPSIIMGLVQKARELAADGHDIIDLGIGEPDFDTPDHVKQAACEAIAAGQTKYTITPGTPQMRQAVLEKFARENNLHYELSQVHVSGGAKQVIFNAMMATVSPGDEVIIPAPYWGSYPDIIAIAQGTAVAVDCPQSSGFILTADQLESAITRRTRWLLLNSPSNPTGGVYSRAHLEELAEVLMRHPQVFVLSDDIYEHLIFDNKRFVSILDAEPELKDRTLVVNGVSKAYAMTGWRLGYAAGPQSVISGMNTVQSQSATHACSISQAAAIAALRGPSDFMVERRNCYQARRDNVVAAISECPGLTCLKPGGAFYVYPGCADLMGCITPGGDRIDTDVDLCTWFLEDHGVSMVPGVAFGLSPHFRISTAASDRKLDTACSRIREACEQLKPA